MFTFVGINGDLVRSDPSLREFLSTLISALGITEHLDHFLDVEKSDLF